jgi:hypothetical protein
LRIKEKRDIIFVIDGLCCSYIKGIKRRNIMIKQYLTFPDRFTRNYPRLRGGFARRPGPARFAGAALALILATGLAGCPDIPASIDTTAPADVGGLAGTPGDGQATLTWTDPTDGDLDHIEITWASGGDTPVSVSKGTMRSLQ